MTYGSDFGKSWKEKCGNWGFAPLGTTYKEKKEGTWDHPHNNKKDESEEGENK